MQKVVHTPTVLGAWCLPVSRAQDLTNQTLSCKHNVMLIAISHHAGSDYTHCQVNKRRPTHQARCLVSSNEQEPRLGHHAGSDYQYYHAKQCRRTIMQGVQWKSLVFLPSRMSENNEAAECLVRSMHLKNLSRNTKTQTGSRCYASCRHHEA